MLSLGSAVLDGDVFSRSLQLLTSRPSEDVARESGLDVKRVRLLPAGLLILQAVAARFDRPLQVGRGGLREGVLLDTA
jgi:exopolyphosphatase/guanosine-5'-triphosphate,3'-diphosphate pyrophosphatase